MENVKVLTPDELQEILKKTAVDYVYDRTLKKRIKYFDFGDLNNYHDKKKYFITLLDNDKIVGLCKIADFNDDDSDMAIAYFSIDPEYRGLGHTHTMAKALIEFCKKENIVLGTSSWSVSGYNRLRNILHKYAKDYDVTFIDHEIMHDVPGQYNSDLKYIGDMTDEEREDHSSLKKHKYIEPKDKFEYNTGLYHIYATKDDFDFAKIDYFYDLMNDHKYRFFSNEGKIDGYFVNNKYYIKDGHHRILAALKHWKKNNDYSRVDKLIKNGKFEEKQSVPNNFYKKLPIKKL